MSKINKIILISLITTLATGILFIVYLYIARLYNLNIPKLVTYGTIASGSKLGFTGKCENLYYLIPSESGKPLQLLIPNSQNDNDLLISGFNNSLVEISSNDSEKKSYCNDKSDTYYSCGCTHHLTVDTIKLAY